MTRPAPQLAAVDAPVQPGVTAPPAYLSAEAAAWWHMTLQDYSLDAHHLKLLEAAAATWDRMQQARLALAEHGGLTFTDSGGAIRLHPAESVERNCRTAFARLLRELDLDAAAPGEGPRPPALPSNRR